jgi:hypothetical protein
METESLHELRALLAAKKQRHSGMDSHVDGVSTVVVTGEAGSHFALN